MASSGPLLSVVVTSRNDNHGGDLIRRMQMFVNGLLEQSSKYHLSTEVLVVEWNPPLDRPRLAEVLSWPGKAGLCTVRIIEVPAEIHSRFEYSDRLPLFQMIGKNVGIRRARGRFILATNIDILFSNEIVSFFASGELMKGHLYRVDRYDAPSDVPDNVSIESQLAYCCHNIIRINRKDGTQVLNGGPTLRGIIKGIIKHIRRVKRLIKGEPSSLHTNACGDFTLMARDHWLAVRGYAEFHMYSFRLDGLLCYAAHYGGARETVLKDPMRIYHIEHLPGSGWTPGLGGDLLEKRLMTAGIPQLSGQQYDTWVAQMRRQHQPIIFNQSEGWGLAAESLPETVVVGGSDN